MNDVVGEYSRLILQGRDVVYDIRSWPVRAECSASYAGVGYGDSSRWNASEAEFY